MRLALVITCAVLLTSCGHIPFIKKGDVTVRGPKDNGTPVTLDSREAKSTLAIPAGTKVATTVTEPVPATPSSPFSPGRTLTEWTFTAPATFDTSGLSSTATTGTIDTSVRKHALDIAERRWLLWTAIACGIAGLVVKSLLPTWPSLSNGLLIAAPLAFAAWKLSEVPPWLWLTALAVVVLLALGYKRAEWDRNDDGIPDFLQRKAPTQPPNEQK